MKENSLVRCRLAHRQLRLAYIDSMQLAQPFPYPSPLEVISVMANTIEFSPAIPLPAVFDAQKRVQELRGYLDPRNLQYRPEQQHVNINTAIKLYEDGKIDGLQPSS